MMQYVDISPGSLSSGRLQNITALNRQMSLLSKVLFVQCCPLLSLCQSLGRAVFEIVPLDGAIPGFLQP